jgi:hypothetical protein
VAAVCRSPEPTLPESEDEEVQSVRESIDESDAGGSVYEPPAGQGTDDEDDDDDDEEEDDDDEVRPCHAILLRRDMYALLWVGCHRGHVP